MYINYRLPARMHFMNSVYGLWPIYLAHEKDNIQNGFMVRKF